MRAHGDLEGRVEDSSGTPVHEAQVELRRGSAQGQFLRRTVTNHEGRFFLADLPDETLELVVSKAGFQPAAHRIEGVDHVQNLALVLIPELPATEISVFGAIPRSAASSSVLRRQEFSQRVIDDTADILRVVPGLTVVQHAGGGKANQYLIRGFDADHGTDVAISFAGIPVNMTSHAHGQGYADLNFLIPETLESIDVYKGPYFAEFGNLATAGAAVLRLRESFDESFVSLEGGRFESGRALLGWSPQVDWTRGFLALESRYTNGPFLEPQAFRKFNLTSRWSFELPAGQTLSLLGTLYEGRWNQSGQIPLRAVEAGTLDRFGSVDASEGGDSTRFNFSLSHRKLWANQALNSQFYFVHYQLDLFSNFTFFLQDPVRGDGIQQADDRRLTGGHLQYHHPLVEDGSARADAYTVTDLYLSHPLSERWKAVLGIENLFDAEVKEAQTFFESRLPFESEPVADNHFTPGNPFTARIGIEYTF